MGDEGSWDDLGDLDELDEVSVVSVPNVPVVDKPVRMISQERPKQEDKPRRPVERKPVVREMRFPSEAGYLRYVREHARRIRPGATVAELIVHFRGLLKSKDVDPLELPYIKMFLFCGTESSKWTAIMRDVLFVLEDMKKDGLLT